MQQLLPGAVTQMTWIALGGVFAATDARIRPIADDSSVQHHACQELRTSELPVWDSASSDIWKWPTGQQTH